VGAVEYDTQMDEARIDEQRHHVFIATVVVGQALGEAFVNTRRVLDDILILGDVGGRKGAHFSQDISVWELATSRRMTCSVLTFPTEGRSSIRISPGSIGRSLWVDPYPALASSLLW
jgi:hypothetical protein